ncbi:hypothetical protein EE612_003915 [Oryza sativa]|nr:hypothetical protein EE612_003915 [Oryza sativa]
MTSPVRLLELRPAIHLVRAIRTNGPHPPADQLLAAC